MRRIICTYLWTLAALAQPQTPPPVPHGKGSIEGIVSDGASGEPLKKAQVTVGGSNPVPLIAITDAAGSFIFRHVPEGTYWLTASKVGYNPPKAIIGGEPNVAVALGKDEQKKDVVITLLPGGTISGRVVNEEGMGVRGCSMSAVQPVYEQNRRKLTAVSGGMGTNDKGEYRIQNLAPGRYYVYAHCQSQLPAAHPLLLRSDPRTPHETYLPQLYGGGLDPATATKLAVNAGASLDGVDFRVTRIPAYTLRGRITGRDPQTLSNGANVMLMPVNHMMRDLMTFGAGADSLSHKFEIPAVIPGSYLLVAFINHDGAWMGAQRAVEVGATPPEPLEIAVSGLAELPGSVQFDCDDHLPLENGQVALLPFEGPFFMQQPRAQMDKDGAFTLTGVMPSRWRLTVSAPGYLKSASLAGQEVSPFGFQTGAAAGPLRISMGCKMASLSVSVAGAPAGRQVSAVMFPEDVTHFGVGLERVGASAAPGNAQIEFGGLPPGHYRVFASDVQNLWPIQERQDLLKALESRTAVVDVPEGGKVSVTVDLIPREDLARTLADQQ